jgi:protein ImuA
VIWITTLKTFETLNPDAMADHAEPGNVVFVQAARSADLLWAMEETLRSGCAPVVVGDLPAPPAMTPVRRLHLAAETGCGAGLCRPLGLLLTPEEGGAPGIETRWGLTPAYQSGLPRWTLSRLRARMAPPRDWVMQMGPSGMSPCIPQAHSAPTLREKTRKTTSDDHYGLDAAR